MNVAGFVVFLVILLSVLGALNFYVFRWAKRAFGLGPRALRWLMVIQWSSIVGMVLGRVAGRVLSEGPVRALLAVTSTVQLAVIITGVLLLVVDAALLARRGFDWARGTLARSRRAESLDRAALTAPASPDAPSPPDAPSTPPSAGLPRRAFITQAAAGSAFLIGGSSSLYGALSGRHDYTIEEVPVRIPGLAKAFDGFSIVQLSDVHIGTFTGEAELATAVDLVRRAKPDLIVLTGDLLDNDARLAHRLGRFVRRLGPLAREGVVAISGNHDFYAGMAEFEVAIRGGGGRLLRNQGAVIGGAEAGFSLLGVDDVWAKRLGGGPDLERAVRSLPALDGKVSAALDLPRVLLCHNPSYFAQAAGKVALQLSGHTHGGQVNLGIRPADYLLPGGWVAGTYRMGGSELYVNRGFGTVGPPARIGAAPEVTRIVLTA